jgi:hypothetical protein
MIDNSINKIAVQAEREFERRARNIVLMQNTHFLVMLVVGPNRRTDYHYNNTDVNPKLVQNASLFDRNSCTKSKEISN